VVTGRDLTGQDQAHRRGRHGRSQILLVRQYTFHAARFTELGAARIVGDGAAVLVAVGDGGQIIVGKSNAFVTPLCVLVDRADLQGDILGRRSVREVLNTDGAFGRLLVDQAPLRRQLGQVERQEAQLVDLVAVALAQLLFALGLHGGIDLGAPLALLKV
jgi:hypothetical protein